MKFLFTALVVFLLAVVIALVAREDPGYIVINYRDWTIETSLVLGVVAVLLAFVALYFVIRFLVNAGRLPRNLGQWRARRLHLKSHRALDQGVLALINGQWKEAERNLIRYTSVNESPLLNYLFAARAAEKQGAHGRRDRYLELARAHMPRAETAIGLTRAELLIQEGKVEDALKTLEHLRRREPGQEAVTRRLLTLYGETHDWDSLLRLLPAARRQGIIGLARMRELEAEAYAGLLDRAGREGDLRQLRELWERMHRDLRRQAGMVATFVQQLIRCNAHEEAEAVLHQFLSRHWNEDLAYLYGVVQHPDPLIHLARAETLFRHHKDRESAALLLTMGRLCKRNGLWGKARQFFEACLALEEHPEALSELAGVLEQMGESEAALEYYRKGMLMKMPEAVRRLPQQGETGKGSMIPVEAAVSEG
ncbi:MAG TPA: heme biosynthesis protein HemY [Gammaproteobacteria bacterium]|nr:heme biosynthesis protein HemY [Gammaproteobacteria bacterium]